MLFYHERAEPWLRTTRAPDNPERYSVSICQFTWDGRAIGEATGFQLHYDLFAIVDD
jgi:hypothetical protein